MIPVGALLLVFAQAGASVAGWGSARPVECAPLDGNRAQNVWERAKSPALRRYCDLLARGAARLASSSSGPGSMHGNAAAREVLAIADDAERTMGGRAGPLVLRGRALAKMGEWKGALEALRAAKGRDERALDDPQSLLAFARALARAGSAAEAQDAYRALLPRASVLAASDRGAASVEAGLLAMGRGASGLDEAITVLRQARRDAQDVTQTFAVMALALALDRAGESEEARAVLADRVHADPRPILGEARVIDLLAMVGGPLEGRAAAALALEAIDPRAAQAEWTAYVEASAPGAPWTEHATKHRAPRAAASKPTPHGAR